VLGRRPRSSLQDEVTTSCSNLPASEPASFCEFLALKPYPAVFPSAADDSSLQWHVECRDGIPFVGPISKITRDFFCSPTSETTNLFRPCEDSLLMYSSPITGHRKYKMVSAESLTEVIMRRGYEHLASHSVQNHLKCSNLLKESVLKQVKAVFESPLASSSTALLGQPLSQSLQHLGPLCSSLSSLTAFDFVQQRCLDDKKNISARNLVYQEAWYRRLGIDEQDHRFRGELSNHFRNSGSRHAYDHKKREFVKNTSGSSHYVLDMKGAIFALQINELRTALRASDYLSLRERPLTTMANKEINTQGVDVMSLWEVGRDRLREFVRLNVNKQLKPGEEWESPLEWSKRNDFTFLRRERPSRSRNDCTFVIAVNSGPEREAETEAMKAEKATTKELKQQLKALKDANKAWRAVKKVNLQGKKVILWRKIRAVQAFIDAMTTPLAATIARELQS